MYVQLGLIAVEIAGENDGLFCLDGGMDVGMDGCCRPFPSSPFDNDYGQFKNPFTWATMHHETQARDAPF